MAARGTRADALPRQGARLPRSLAPAAYPTSRAWQCSPDRVAPPRTPGSIQSTDLLPCALLLRAAAAWVCHRPPPIEAAGPPDVLEPEQRVGSLPERHTQHIIPQEEAIDPVRLAMHQRVAPTPGEPVEGRQAGAVVVGSVPLPPWVIRHRLGGVVRESAVVLAYDEPGAVPAGWGWG